MRVRITRFVAGVEQWIVIVLLVLLAVALAAGTIQLVVSVALDSVHRWSEVHAIDELAELRPVFSGFLLILIGLELMKTIAMYLQEHSVHVEVVLTVALIAVARHAIDIDYNAAAAGQLVGTGVLVLALAASHYLFRRSMSVKGRGEGSRADSDRMGDALDA
jgi:uncharacterized membrane protein (DUF373 family)